MKVGNHHEDRDRPRKRGILIETSEVNRIGDRMGSCLDLQSTISELKRALARSGYTTPGQEKISDVKQKTLRKSKETLTVKRLDYLVEHAGSLITCHNGFHRGSSAMAGK